MPTTKIHVQAVDNELYISATDGSKNSIEICHLKSGFGRPVDYEVDPSVILQPGGYALFLVGYNWGGAAKFKITLTTDGVDTTYESPSNNDVGVWSQVVNITV